MLPLVSVSVNTSIKLSTSDGKSPDLLKFKNTNLRIPKITVNPDFEFWILKFKTQIFFRIQIEVLYLCFIQLYCYYLIVTNIKCVNKYVNIIKNSYHNVENIPYGFIFRLKKQNHHGKTKNCIFELAIRSFGF